MNPKRVFRERRVARPFLRGIVPVVVVLLAVVMVLLAVAGSGDSAGSGPATSPGVQVTKSVPFVRESIDEIRALAPLRPRAAPGNRVIPLHRIRRGSGTTDQAGPPSAGPALAAPSLASSPARSAPVVDSSFAGLGNPPHGEDVIPPDTMGAAGPNHLVSILNSDFGVFDKSGTQLQKVSLQSFWGSLGTGVGEPADFPFDPKILYDQHSGRFVAVTLGGTSAPGSWVMIAVSSTSDPTGAWSKWAIDADKDDDVQLFNNSADFPGLGVDAFNVYVTANMFNGDASQYSKVWVIPKTRLLAGSNPITWFEFRDFPGFDFTMQPAHTFGTPGAEYFLFEGSANHLALAWMDNISGTPVWHAPVSVPVAPYVSTDALPGAPQLGDPNTIHTSDTRLLNVVYRNGSAWATHHVLGPGGNVEVAWYRINPSTGKVLSQGRITDPTLWYYYPSIGVNANGDVAIGMSGSSATDNVGGYYTARRFGDPGGTTQPVSLLKAGEHSYFKTLEKGDNRWGDFSATVVDPNDDLTFWTLQEYARTPDPVTGDSRWGTWWGSFRTSDVLSPDNVVATLPDNLTVRLTWNDRAAGESAYVVERRVGSGGTFSVLATLPPNSVSYADPSGVSQGTAYYYRVGAVGALGTAYSDEVLVGTPSPPSSGGGGGGCVFITRSGGEAPFGASLFSAGILLLPACALGIRRFFRRRERTVPNRHPLC